MIRQHKSLKRSERIVKSLVDKLNKDLIGIDGVYEIFIDEKNNQGYMVKFFKNFNDQDLCVWIYESLTHGHIETVVGNASSRDSYNNWINKGDLEVKRYPIIKNIQRNIVSDLENTILNNYELQRNFKL